jgi:hypothetical protein
MPARARKTLTSIHFSRQKPHLWARRRVRCAMAAFCAPRGLVLQPQRLKRRASSHISAENRR